MPIEFKIPLICMCIVVYGTFLYTDLGPICKMIYYKFKEKRNKNE